jgi:hypothetical protein
LHFSEYVAKGLCSHTAGLSEFSKSERSRSFRESIEDCLSRHRARRFRCGRVVEDTKREMVVGSLKDQWQVVSSGSGAVFDGEGKVIALSF